MSESLLIYLPLFACRFRLLELAGIDQKEITMLIILDWPHRSQPAGVSVLVKGSSTRGLSADLDGKIYYVSAPADIVLVVLSFVGMGKQEIPSKGRSSILVTMRSSSFAFISVVVGYGSSPLVALTGWSHQEWTQKDVAISPAFQCPCCGGEKVWGMEIRVSSVNRGGWSSNYSTWWDNYCTSDCYGNYWQGDSYWRM